MKKLCTLALLVASTFLLVNCSHKTGKAIAGKANVETKTYTPEQVHAGMALYQTSCAQCHKLHDPTEFTTGKWNRVLNSMIPRTHLNEGDALSVRAYVLANAQKD